MFAKGEASASLSFCSFSLSILPSLKTTVGKSVYFYSLSLLPNLPPLSEGSILRNYIEEAHRGKEAYRGGKK